MSERLIDYRESACGRLSIELTYEDGTGDTPPAGGTLVWRPSPQPGSRGPLVTT